jgi:hypothetical protein
LNFSKFQAYLRDQALNLAPVPFLYPYALSLYDLSNTGKDFMRTLYTVETLTALRLYCTHRKIGLGAKEYKRGHIRVVQFVWRDLCARDFHIRYTQA